MFLLDTNVISELRKVRRGTAEPRVVAWFAGRPLDSCYLSVITLLEMRLGVLKHLRKDAMQSAVYQSWLDEVSQVDFRLRILPVDLAVATRCAELHIPDPMPMRDSLIAATGLVHNLAIVTRDVKDF